MTNRSRAFFSERSDWPCFIGAPDALGPMAGVSCRSTIRNEEKSLSDMVPREIAYKQFHITYVMCCRMQGVAMESVKFA
ncbi:hypothetical protein GCM10007874_44810 [Labrys miyagiensis]|uniref:Uncharacterized protein n=1 Tax=Labrys miyagiensis TaxID=346912 RepID=A0ABQ6CRW8_9HYPH|nr:hypothetical protein GCM10007874_44810 [Labrys miyagiensis]